MELDIHVPRFTWPGGPEAIGPTFATLARTAEAIGVRTLSVMDHWFQMDMLWPAEEPMLEGYTRSALLPPRRSACASGCWSAVSPIAIRGSWPRR